MDTKTKLAEIRKFTAARTAGTLSEDDFNALSAAMRQGDDAYLRKKRALGFDARPRRKIPAALRRAAEFLLALIVGIAALLAGFWAVAAFENGAGNLAAGLYLLLAGGALYFLPTFAAQHRAHPQATGIFVLNLVLGWTFLGWAIALVWAFSNSKTA